jgi:WD40 repeat protein
MQAPRLYSVEDAGPQRVSMVPPPIVAEAAAVSADGSRFAIGNYYAAQLWNADGSPVGSPLTHPGHTWPMALTPDGEWLATTSHPCLVRLWRVERPALRGRFPALEQDPAPNCLIVSRDGDRFVTQGETDGARHLSVIVAATGRPAGKPLPVRATTLHGDLSPDGSRMYAYFADRELRGWEVETGRELFPPMPAPAEPLSLRVTPDGDGLIGLLADGTIEKRDARTGELLKAAQIGRPSTAALPRRLSFGPDGKRFATAGYGWEVKLWNLADLTLARTFKLPTEQLVDCAVFSPSGKHLAIGGSGSHYVSVFDVETGESLASLRHPDHLFSLAFDPVEGSRLLTSSHDSRARVWNWRKGELAIPTMAHAGEVGDAQYSPDGRWIATADSHQARIWEASTGRPMTPWLPLAKADEPPVYFANQLSFLRGGDSLLVGLRTRHQSLFDFGDLKRPVRPTLTSDALIELSELNAGGLLDPSHGIDSMTGEEWLKRWKAFRERHPEIHAMD